MRQASLSAMVLGAMGLAAFATLASADPPDSSESAAAKRQKWLDQATTPQSSSEVSGSSSQEPSSDAAPPPAPAPTPEQSWLASLKPMPEGGWTYLNTTTSGNVESALFVSDHHVTVRGTVVAAWFRWEVNTAQTDTYSGQSYQSYVMRYEISCEKDATRDLAITYYSDSNLEGTTWSQVFDADKVQWSPAVPGTIGEFMVEWGCAQIHTHKR